MNKETGGKDFVPAIFPEDLGPYLNAVYCPIALAQELGFNIENLVPGTLYFLIDHASVSTLGTRNQTLENAVSARYWMLKLVQDNNVRSKE